MCPRPFSTLKHDQALAARQVLLKLRSGVSGGGIGFVNALQSLGTFSQKRFQGFPNGVLRLPDATNPNFQKLLVYWPIHWNDGTAASVGEYLVNRRFLLQRLNWLTYKGPSGPSVANPRAENIPSSGPGLGNADYDMWLLTRGALVADRTASDLD